MDKKKRKKFRRGKPSDWIHGTLCAFVSLGIVSLIYQISGVLHYPQYIVVSDIIFVIMYFVIGGVMLKKTQRFWNKFIKKKKADKNYETVQSW